MPTVKKNPRSSCDGCTLCCKVLEVKPLQKAAGASCIHCTSSSGCAIWRLRPPICRGYACLWYANPKFPDRLRPDRCGVVFEPGGKRIMLAMVDPLRPQSWRQGIAKALIAKFVDAGTAVIVQVGSDKHFILPEGMDLGECWREVETGVRARARAAGPMVEV